MLLGWLPGEVLPPDHLSEQQSPSHKSTEGTDYQRKFAPRISIQEGGVYEYIF